MAKILGEVSYLSEERIFSNTAEEKVSLLLNYSVKYEQTYYL